MVGVYHASDEGSGPLRPELEALLSPLSEAEFRKKHWACSPFFAAGAPARLEMLRASLGGFAPAQLLELRQGSVVATRPPDNGAQPGEVVSDPTEALRRFDNGDSLLFNLDPLHPKIRPWFTAFTGPLAPQPNRSGVIAVCSPPGRGTSVHFDRHDVFNIGLAGTKTWDVASDPNLVEPVNDWHCGQTVSAELSAYWTPEPGREVPVNGRRYDVSPGSVLYVPRGWFHGTVASDQPTVGLSFVVDVVSYRSLFERVLADLTLRSPDLRARANDLWRSPSLDGHRALEDRLAELRELVGRLRPEDFSCPPERAEVNDTTRMRRCALATRRREVVGGTPLIRLERVDRSEAAWVQTEDEAILAWIDQRTAPFDLNDAASALPAYGPDALGQMFETLTETGYLTLT